MAEETPGNLGSVFGGWAAGRAAGNKRIDASVDRLEGQINKLTAAVENLTKTLTGGNKNGGGGGPTQAAGTANGGGATIGGQPVMGGAHAGGTAGFLSNISNLFGQASGAYAATGGGANGGDGGTHAGGTSWNPLGAGGPGGYWGSHANGGNWMSQHGATFAKGAVAAGVTGLGIYTRTHYGSQVTAQTLASMSGQPWQTAYQNGMTGNYTAHGNSDFYATMSAMQQRSGFVMGSSGWNSMTRNVQSYSAVNPTLSNASGANASLALAAPRSFNMMRGMGINPLGANGQGDPRSVARQLLAKMNTQNVKTMDQAAALFGPSGNATVTLNSFVSNGFLPPESYPAVRSEMWNILVAQVHGMSYQSYNRNAVAANSSDTARDSLRNAGIASDTLVQTQYRREGGVRASEVATISGFTKGVQTATTAVNKFRDVLNGILGIPGVGGTVGLLSGGTGTMPILGSLINKIPGSSLLGHLGGKAAGGVLPGYSPGRDNHRFFSPTGGTIDLSGGEGILIPQATKALGGEAGIKAINDRFRKSFAEGGVWRPTTGPITQGLHDSWTGYPALDFGEKIGTPVAAVAPGKVTESYDIRGYEPRNRTQNGYKSYGRVIVINNGKYSTLYAHLNDRDVSVGANVRGGQVIGHSGATGYVTGPHLHFGAKGVSPYNFVHGSTSYSQGGSAVSGGGSAGAGGGGGNGGSAGGGLGAGSGISNGSSSTQPNGGPLGAGSGGGLWGTYSEVAALGLGGGGGVGMSAYAPNGGSAAGSAGGTTGGGFGNVNPGGPGNLSVGSYNFHVGRVPMSDVAKIMGKVGVFGTQETNGDFRQVGGYLKSHGWGYYQGQGVDTGIAYDKSRYTMLQHGQEGMVGSISGGRNHPRAVTYALLRDKTSGSTFWVMDAHPQVHGGKGGAMGQRAQSEYAVMNALYSKLRKTGAPVIVTGDMNNPHIQQQGLLRGVGGYQHGIDYVLGGGAKKTGGGYLPGHGAAVHSDHPFVYADFHLPGGGGGGGGSSSQNIALGRAMASNYGWTGGQWNALKTLWMHESGWSTTADNPGSSAYGIPQAMVGMHRLPSGYYSHGTGSGASFHGYGGDPRAQIGWGLNYIKGRYGNPENAWKFWQQHNWYDAGAWNLKDDHDARVHKGEMILPTKIADIVRQELEAPGIGANLGRKSTARGGGMEVVFQSGAIQINFPSTDITKPMARTAATMVVDAMMEDRRMRELAES